MDESQLPVKQDQTQPEIVEPDELARATASSLKLMSADELRDLYRIANVFAASTLIPRELQQNPSNVFLVLAQAVELGISPGQALQSVYIVNGRASVFGDLFLALIQRHAKYEWHREYFEGEFPQKSFTAVCEIKRAGIEPAFERRFSIDDADRAKLWGKQGPWTNYPKRMLQMRARTWCGRDSFADALKGLTTVEEMRDVDAYPKEAKEVAVDVTAPARGGEGLKARMAAKVAAGVDGTTPFDDTEKPEPKAPDAPPNEPDSGQEPESLLPPDEELLASERRAEREE